MGQVGETKLFSGLKGLFIVCFSLALIFVLCVSYPLFGTILLLCGVAFLCWRYEIKRFSLILFVLSFLLHAAAVVFITTPIISDFAIQYKAAQQFAAGDYSFQGSSYFQRWGYQTGLVIYQGIFLKIWKSPVFLRLINCFVAAGTNVLIYLIAKDYFQKKAAQCTGIAYALFLYPLTLVTVLCNNIPSGFFLYFSVFLIMGKRFEKYSRPFVYALSGVSLALANALRPDAPLVLVPLLVYFVFRLVSKFTKENLWYYAKRFLALFLTFVILSAGMSGLVRLTGVNSAGLDNHDSLWGVVVGTNPKFSGVYNNEDGVSIKQKEESGMSRSEAEIQVIKEHINVPPAKLLELMINKVQKFWWDRGLTWSMKSMQDNYPTLYQLLEDLDGAMFTCMLVLAGIGALAVFWKRKTDFKVYLIPFIIFTAFAVYLILEVQPRYAYVMQIAVFILAAGGVQTLVSGARALFRKIKKETALP